MLKIFKKDFIPHEANDHRPHLLRWEAILVILGIVLLAEVFFLAQVFVLEPLTGIFSTILPATLTDLANLSRQNDNLASLTVSPVLEEAARLKAEDMAAKGYFAHTSPAGLTPWHWLDRAGYKFITAGENLAINFVDSQDVANAWMNSPTHRANILNNQFTEIGIAAVKGVYNSRETVFIAQFFGRPKAEISEPAKANEDSLTTIENLKTVAAPASQASVSVAPAVASSTEDQAQSFALVMGETQEEVAPMASVSATVAAAGVAPLSRWQKFLAKPRAMTNYLFLMFFTIISLALVLKIFVKIKIQHPPLIINGLLALIIISSLMLLNQSLAFWQAKIF